MLEALDSRCRNDILQVVTSSICARSSGKVVRNGDVYQVIYYLVKGFQLGFGTPLLKRLPSEKEL